MIWLPNSDLLGFKENDWNYQVLSVLCWQKDATNVLYPDSRKWFDPLINVYLFGIKASYIFLELFPGPYYIFYYFTINWFVLLLFYYTGKEKFCMCWIKYMHIKCCNFNFENIFIFISYISNSLATISDIFRTEKKNDHMKNYYCFSIVVYVRSFKNGMMVAWNSTEIGKIMKMDLETNMGSSG